MSLGDFMADSGTSKSIIAITAFPSNRNDTSATGVSSKPS